MVLRAEVELNRIRDIILEKQSFLATTSPQADHRRTVRGISEAIQYRTLDRQVLG
jgi:hypothetical protein